MKRFDADPFYANLEELGEEQVRTNLAAGSVWEVGKANLAREWLARKAEERARAIESEEIEIARSASIAARDAADAARSANTRATMALIIAAITAIVLIADLLFELFHQSAG